MQRRSHQILRVDFDQGQVEEEISRDDTAGVRRPVDSPTTMLLTPVTRWLLVKMYPPSSIMTPEPEPDWVCEGLAGTPRVRIVTTDERVLRRRQEQKGFSRWTWHFHSLPPRRSHRQEMLSGL